MQAYYKEIYKLADRSLNKLLVFDFTTGNNRGIQAVKIIVSHVHIILCQPFSKPILEGNESNMQFMG